MAATFRRKAGPYRTRLTGRLVLSFFPPAQRPGAASPPDVSGISGRRQAGLTALRAA